MKTNYLFLLMLLLLLPIASAQIQQISPMLLTKDIDKDDHSDSLGDAGYNPMDDPCYY